MKARVLGPERLHLEAKPGWSADTAELLRLAFVFSPASRGSAKDLIAVINRATATPSAKDKNKDRCPSKLTTDSQTDIKDLKDPNNA